MIIYFLVEKIFKGGQNVKKKNLLKNIFSLKIFVLLIFFQKFSETIAKRNLIVDSIKKYQIQIIFPA